MTKKEKENLLINAWNLVGLIERSEKKGRSDEYLDGLYQAQKILLKSFDIDFIKIQVAKNRGLSYDKMKEYLKQN